MRILVVAMSDSIHTTRWLAQIADQGWDIHLFPSIDLGLTHPELRNVTVHHSIYGSRHSGSDVTHRGLNILSKDAATGALLALHKLRPTHRARQLARLINRLKPDIIHSMEFQAAGYLVLEAKKRVKRHFPPWIATNWGSDIFLFGRLKEHEQKIREILAQCDFYSCECERDVHLAKQYGLKGEVMPVFPNTGGFDLKAIKKLRSKLPSQRRFIMLKGYQDWAGRGLVGLRALERCADLLKGYEIVIHSPSKEMGIAAELFTHTTGIPTVVLPRGTTHSEIMKRHGQSRISLGLSISDAISTSFLEALVAGSFPIQSWTSCANEWIKDGKSGLLVPPEDPDTIEQALRRALTDDHLVDEAAEINWQTAELRLDHTKIQPRAVQFYQHAYNKTDR